MRGHDCWLIHEVDLSNQRVLASAPVFGMYIAYSGSYSKDIALKE